VPIAAVAVALSRTLLPESREEARPSLDVLGALLVTAGIGLLVYGVTRGQQDGFTAVVPLSIFAAAAVALTLFARLETRIHAPLVPFRIFSVGKVLGANLCSLLLAAVIAGQSFFLTLFMQQVLGYSSMKTGLAFLPISLLAFAGSVGSARVAARERPLAVMAAGLLLIAAALALMTRISTASTYFGTLLPAYVLFGLGLGLSFVSATIAATGGVPPTDQGLASGLLSSAQQVGFAVGVAALVAVAVQQTRSTDGTAVERTLAGFNLGLWVATAVAVTAALVALLFEMRGQRTGLAAQTSGTMAM